MEIQKDQTSRFRFIGIAGIALCALCCLLPIVGAFFGFGALVSLGTRLEKLAILFLLLSGAMFIIYAIKKSKKVKSCEPDCSCKTEVQKI